MDLRDRIEIFIPAEAEVKTIPLWSLPNPVLKRMGLPVCESNGSKKLINSPKGTWICPAVVRRKGQKSANSGVESTLTLLSRECRASPGPFRMSFLFSNPMAFKVLKDIVPGGKLSTILPHGTSLPQGLASKSYRTAVVVYAGRIYLSVRKPGQGPGQRETAQPPPQPVPPLRRQFKSQKKVMGSSHCNRCCLLRFSYHNAEGQKPNVRGQLLSLLSSLIYLCAGYLNLMLSLLN